MRQRRRGSRKSLIATSCDVSSTSRGCACLVTRKCQRVCEICFDVPRPEWDSAARRSGSACSSLSRAAKLWPERRASWEGWSGCGFQLSVCCDPIMSALRPLPVSIWQLPLTAQGRSLPLVMRLALASELISWHDLQHNHQYKHERSEDPLMTTTPSHRPSLGSCHCDQLHTSMHLSGQDCPCQSN